MRELNPGANVDMKEAGSSNRRIGANPTSFSRTEERNYFNGTE